MELVVNFSAKMLFDDFCLKIYFWPFLTYLANLKGICPTYPGPYPPPPPTPLPTITPFPTISTVPTYQPTPPPPITTTTLPPCPAMPLVCLANGDRPIPYCPCIDPRQQQSQALMQQQLQQQQQQLASQSLAYQAVSSQQPQVIQPVVTTGQLMISHSETSPATASQPDQPMTSAQFLVMQQQLAAADPNSSSPPMTNEQLVDLLDVQSLELRKGTQVQSGSEMMVFSHLPGSKRRKRSQVALGN